MTIQPHDNTNIVFVHKDGTEATRVTTAGYHFNDFFRDDAWIDGEYATAEDVVAAAKAAYVGADMDGIGVRLDVWDGFAWSRRHLDA